MVKVACSIGGTTSNMRRKLLAFHRSVSTASAAVYAQHGAPDKVIQIKTVPIPPLGAKQVLVKFLASPINPADLNMVEGVYKILPPLPAIGGNEGVGVVVDTGSDVTEVKVNDWVIPSLPGFGTWRTHAVCSETDVDRVPNDLSVAEAATIAINPCTAFRMLMDFVSLKPGDVVVQNGANSGVGQAVIQIAKTLNVRTVNIIRDRPDLSALKSRLEGLGADVVVTEAVLGKKDEFVSILKSSGLDKSKIVLGLNCVGGKSAGDIARLLREKGTLVTYGGMSKRPLQIPTAPLIFQDIALRGFWLSRWVGQQSREAREQMLNRVSELIREKKLTQWVEEIPFSRFQEALNRSMAETRNGKVLLKYDS